MSLPAAQHQRPDKRYLLKLESRITEAITCLRSPQASSEEYRQIVLPSYPALDLACFRGGTEESDLVLVSGMQVWPEARALRNALRLTPRQAEVARLLAERKSNKEIARSLEVSQKTAWRHTEDVLAKLGLSSRRHVAAVIAQVGSPHS